MQLGGEDAELGDHHQRLGGQADPVGIGQALQRPTHPMSFERGDLTGCQTEQGRVEPGRPLAEPAERLAAQRQVGRHQPHCHGRFWPVPAIVTGYMASQQRGEPGAVQKVVEHRRTHRWLTSSNPAPTR